MNTSAPHALLHAPALMESSRANSDTDSSEVKEIMPHQTTKNCDVKPSGHFYAQPDPYATVQLFKHIV